MISNELQMHSIWKHQTQLAQTQAIIEIPDLEPLNTPQQSTEIRELHSLVLQNQLKCDTAQYKLKNNGKKDRNSVEDSVYYALQCVISRYKMSDDQIALSLCLTPEGKQLGWSQTFWRLKIKQIRLGHSWGANKLAANAVLAWCRTV